MWHHVRYIESICSLPIISAFMRHQNIKHPYLKLTHSKGTKAMQRTTQKICLGRKCMRNLQLWLTSNLYKYPKLSHYSRMVSHCMFQFMRAERFDRLCTNTQYHIHTHIHTLFDNQPSTKCFACTFSTHQTFGRYSFTKCSTLVAIIFRCLFI